MRVWLLTLLLASGCGRIDFMRRDAGADASMRDAGLDAAMRDAGLDAGRDAGTIDGGAPDAGPPRLPWVRFFEGTTALALSDLTTDPTGAVYLTGSFTGELRIESDRHTSTGRIAAYAAAYEADGTLRWSRGYAGEDIVDGRGIDVDEDGTSYLAGLVMEAATFGTTPIDAGPTQDVLLLVHDASGNVTLARNYVGTGLGGDNAQGRTIALAGDLLFIAGLYGGDLDFGVSFLPFADDEAAFAAGLGLDGTARWAYPLDGPGESFGNGGGLGDRACAVGQFDGSIDMGAGSRSSAGGTDIFVVGYDRAGARAYEARYGSAANEVASDAVATSTGACVFVGQLAGAVDFDGRSDLPHGGNDCFVVRLDPSGAPEWARVVGGTGSDTCGAVELDSTGRVYVAGAFRGSATFGTRTLTSAGGADAFFLVLEANGDVRHAEAIGGIGDESATAIDLQDEGRAVVIGGSFSGSTEIVGIGADSGPVPDAYVVRLLVP